MLHILEGSDLTKAVDFSAMYSYLCMTGIMRHPDYYRLICDTVWSGRNLSTFRKNRAVSFFRMVIIRVWWRICLGIISKAQIFLDKVNQGQIINLLK